MVISRHNDHYDCCTCCTTFHQYRSSLEATPPVFTTMQPTLEIRCVSKLGRPKTTCTHSLHVYSFRNDCSVYLFVSSVSRDQVQVHTKMESWCSKGSSTISTKLGGSRLRCELHQAYNSTTYLDRGIPIDSSQLFGMIQQDSHR